MFIYFSLVVTSNKQIQKKIMNHEYSLKYNKISLKNIEIVKNLHKNLIKSVCWE
jgi:hypothetical protein